jgi:hypothetical protein
LSGLIPARQGAPARGRGSLTSRLAFPLTRCRALALGGALCDKWTMPKHPKPTAEPSTASDRLTPQEIDRLRESARRMGEKMRSILAKEKQAEQQ